MPLLPEHKLKRRRPSAQAESLYPPTLTQRVWLYEERKRVTVFVGVWSRVVSKLTQPVRYPLARKVSIPVILKLHKVDMTFLLR